MERKELIFIPWVYSVSSGTPPTYTFSATNTLNQHCSKVTIPSGTRAITQLKVYAAARSSSVSTRLVLWAVGSSALKQSSTFTMAVGSESGGGQYWYTKDISSYQTSGGDFWVGLYRNPSGGHIAGTTSSGHADDGYRKTNTASFPSVASMSGYSTHTGREFYVGAFYITKPIAPSGLSVTRVSDNSQSLSWTNTDTVDYPYDKIEVYRYDNSTANYYLKATLSSSATSYTDTSTSINKYYKYKVRGVNDADNGYFSTEDDINTTPYAPTNVVATRVSGNVQITWTDNGSNEEYYKVQRRTSTDGITWTSYSTLTSTLAANSTSYTDTSPANYNQYKISCTVSNPSLESGQITSNEVVILQAPDAPTLLDPDGNEVFDASDAKAFSWQHNPNDGSSQTKFSLQYKVSGGSYPGTPQYDEVSSTTEGVTIPASTFTNGNDYVYQVKTWGDYTTGSDWSTEATFKCTTTPTAVITSPTAVSNYTSSSLTLQWTYSQAESNDQVQYLAKLYDASDMELESKSIVSNVTSGSSDNCTFDYTLENNTNYKCTLQVKEEDGLWSDEVDVTFTTEFLQPTTPTLDISFNESNGTMIANIANPDVIVDYEEIANQDTYFDYINSSTNYDGNNLICEYTSGTDYKSIGLDFDLSFFVGKTIVSANLVLTRTGAFSGSLTSHVKYINSSWDEATETFTSISSKLDSTTYDSHAHGTGSTETWDLETLLDDIADGTITDYEGLYIEPSIGSSTDTFYDGSNAPSDTEKPTMFIEIDPLNAETDHNILYRSVDGGDWEIVDNDIPKNTSVIDYIPGLGNNNNYYVEAVSASAASTNSSEVDLDVGHTGYYYFNAGDAFSAYVGLIGDNDITENYEKDTKLNRYEGRTSPVKYQGTQVFNNISFTSEILNEYVDSMKTLISTVGDTFYRDYQGRWFKCAITSPNFKMKSNTSYDFHCIVTKVEDV